MGQYSRMIEAAAGAAAGAAAKATAKAAFKAKAESAADQPRPQAFCHMSYDKRLATEGINA